MFTNVIIYDRFLFSAIADDIRDMFDNEQKDFQDRDQLPSLNLPERESDDELRGMGSGMDTSCFEVQILEDININATPQRKDVESECEHLDDTHEVSPSRQTGC